MTATVQSTLVRAVSLGQVKGIASALSSHLRDESGESIARGRPDGYGEIFQSLKLEESRASMKEQSCRCSHRCATGIRRRRTVASHKRDTIIPSRFARVESTMNQSTSGPEIFATNPYADHPSLSETEAEVLWQYAKLSQNIKEVRATGASLRARHTSDKLFRKLRAETRSSSSRQED